MGWLDVVNWNLETIKKCLFVTSIQQSGTVGSGCEPIFFSLLLILESIQISSVIVGCRSPSARTLSWENMCAWLKDLQKAFLERLEKVGNAEAHSLPCHGSLLGVTKGTGPGRLRACLPAGGSWWLPLFFFLLGNFFFASSKLNSPAQPCYNIPSTYRCE